MKVPEGATQGGVPQLTPADLNGAAVAVATVERVEYRESKFGGKKFVIRFDQFAERELWANKTETACLVTKLGEETDGWIGKTVPLITARQNVGGKTYHVVQVAPAEEWNSILVAADEKAAKPKKAARQR